MRITETFDSAANLSAAPYNWGTQSGVTTFAASGGVVTAPTSGERTNFFPAPFDTLDQEVEFDLVNLPTASSYFDLFARVRASGTNYGGYYVGPEYISGTGWCISLYKYIGDTYTLGIQSPTTLTAGDRIKVEAKVDGTSCRISVYRNGNKITLTGISGTVSADAGDWVDSSPLTGLWGGMYSDASGGSAAWQWDNLAAGDIGAGGETVELDGAISSESTVEGSLQLAVGLQGGFTSVSTIQGSLGLAIPLEGAISSVSRLSGSLGIPTVLQGTIGSASDTAGTLGLVQGLTGTIRSESGLTGELDSGGVIALTGTISSTSQVQGQFALATALTGAIASTSDLAGDLTVAGDMSLVGTASSVSAVQGRLGLATGLAGIAKSTSQVAGGLGLNLLLSSEVRSVSEIHGGIGLSIPLSGTISSESALSGELSIAGADALAGAINSVSALRGELNLLIGLAGSSRSESSLSSELTIGGALELNGTISSVSRLSGVLSTGPYIDLQESIILGAYGSVRIYSNGTSLFTV